MAKKKVNPQYLAVRINNADCYSVYGSGRTQGEAIEDAEVSGEYLIYKLAGRGALVLRSEITIGGGNE